MATPEVMTGERPADTLAEYSVAGVAGLLGFLFLAVLATDALKSASGA